MEKSYEEYMEDPVTLPSSNYEEFREIASEAILSFSTDNKVLNAVNDNNFRIEDYQSLLSALFHQVRMSSSSFAMAAAMTSHELPRIKDYLIHHSEEERSHWAWILNDLRNTDYTGKDPREFLPSIQTEAYLSYGIYLALTFPTGRLAMASVLEGISAKFGSEYGPKFAQNLDLQNNQVQFFLAHGELDKDHANEIFEVLKSTELSDKEWANMCNVCRTTVHLYKQIYNSI